jgi:macrolide-specific efflux system membrane fusion protein
MKLKLLVIILLVAAGGAAVAYSVGGLQLAGTANATPYLTAQATTGDVTDSVAATGTIEPSASYDLGFGAAPVLTTASSGAAGSGTWTVAEVSAQVGQAVKAGDVLARASTVDLRGKLLNAEASLAAARLQEKQAKRALDDASGTDAIRQSKVNRYNAVNARREAQSTVDDLRTQIRFAALPAPIDGIVTAVNIGTGLDSTGTAISLVSTTYEVTADVVERDVSSMSIGQDATITVDAIDATIPGTVSAIAPTASDSGGSGDVVSYPVTVTLAGAPSALRPGMTADITIVTASATDVLTIPAEALRGTAGDYRVQVLGADGTPTTRPVTVGLVTSTTAEITSGLSEGEAVVTGTAADRLATSGGNNGFNRGFGAGEGPVVVNGGPGTFTRP